MTRRALPVVVAALLSAPAAHAATVSVEGSTLTVTGAPGEISSLGVEHNADYGYFSVRDPASPPTRPSACKQFSTEEQVTTSSMVVRCSTSSSVARATTA